MKYQISIITGSVKDGLISFKKEIETNTIQGALESYFGPNNLSIIECDEEKISCTLTTSASPEETIATVASRIIETYPQIKGASPIHRTGDDYQMLLGSTITIKATIVETTRHDKAQLNTLLSDIDALIGWESFKEYAHESARFADKIEFHKTHSCFCSQSYLFSINDGCGLTNGIKLLTLLGVHMGAFSQKYYFEYILSSERIGSKISIKEFLEVISNQDNFGCLVCLDISEFIEKSKQGELKDLLKELAHYTEYYNFVFRVPYIEPHELKQVENILSDILFIRTFAIPPFTDTQLEMYADQKLAQYGFSMNEGAKKIFHSRVREEKSDGRFYGLRTIGKITDEIILLKHKADSERDDDHSSTNNYIISESDIETLSKQEDIAEIDAFEELNEMIGMEKVCERIREIVAQVKVSIQNDKIERPCMHMRFLGAPGTGKTTVARIVGKIFTQNGILSNGYFFEYGARDFCGQYVGQTAPKTAAICRDAYGSVLFIDEAYDLYRGGFGSENDFGKEALTTLIAEMENHRNNLVVIMAGYKEPMEKLMDGNMGLKSRMPFVIEFPSYTKEQLTNIFMQMTQKHFPIKEDLRPAVAEYFQSAPQEFIDSEDFPNARFVRNLYERTWSKAAMRVQLNELPEIEIMAEDFKAATAEKEFAFHIPTTRKRVGF